MSRKGIMLCYPFDEERIKKWGFPVYTQPKLDGDRCKAYYDGQTKCVTLLSSEEHIINSVPHINAFLQKMVIHIEADLVFDGELYNHNLNHDEIRSIVGRTTNLHSNYLTIQYHIFDVPYYIGSLEERMEVLMSFNYLRFNDSIQFIPFDALLTVEEVYEQLHQFIAEGYEGFVVKNPRSFYEEKRSTNWLKYKPMKEDIYTIIGYNQEVDKHGFFKNSLGSVICSTQKGEEFSVGSGLTISQRDIYWKNRNSLIGKHAKIEYQNLTKKRKVPRGGGVILKII